MKDTYKTVKLGDIAEINSRQINKDFSFKNIRYIDIASVTKGSIDNIQDLQTSKAPSRAKRLVKKNDILYSTVRPNLEHYTFIKNDLPNNTVASTGFAVITPNQDLVNPYYLYCLITQSQFTQYLSQVAEQAVSTYPTVSPNVIADLELSLPPLSEQKRIANILSSFDNKIEQLKKENNILEDIAQSIFKEWFVKYNFPNKDGKPYKDNNGKMIDSELGGIPEEWIAGKLGDIGIRINERVGEEKNTIVLSAINSGELVKSQDFFEKKVYSNSLRNYIKCQKGDFAYNPARINIGSIGRNKLSDNCCVSPVYIVFRPSDSYGIWLEFLLTSKRFKQHTNLVANGSVRQSLNYDGFSIFPCIIPSKVIIEQFNNLISIIHNQTTISANKIKTLNILRNELINDLI